MKVLDFTPKWYRESLTRKRSRKNRIVLSCTLAGVCVIVGSLNHIRLGQLRYEAKILDATFHSQTPALAAIDDMQSKLSLQKRKSVLCANLAGGVKAYQILAELSRMLPSSMVLTRFRLVQSDRLSITKPSNQGVPVPARRGGRLMVSEADSGMSLEGFSIVDTDVGRLVAALNRCSICRQVKLESSKEAMKKGRRVTQFLVTCRIEKFQ